MVQDRSKNPRETVQFRYNKKMLPKNNSLKGYFDNIDEIIPNVLSICIQKFELEAFHRETDLSIRLYFTLTPDSEGMQL